MPYTQNPHMPKVRQQAAAFAARKGVRAAARRFGVSPGTITKWTQKAAKLGYHPIPTRSSKPKRHPKELPEALVWQIFQKRLLLKRSAEVVHQALKNDGVEVSLASVKRTLDRTGLLKKRSPWKRYHPHQDRPRAEKPGDLVEIDTIHLMQSEKKRMYVFVLIDVCSRWAYAKAYEKMNGRASLGFIAEAERRAPFRFGMLQSDHGPEWSSWFVARVKKEHRYTRIGKPNDNAHIERFNRTLQEECLASLPREARAINGALKAYLRHYNNERLHFGLGLRTPRERLECFQAIEQN